VRILFEEVEDIEEIIATYKRIVGKQNEYLKTEFSPEETLRDTIEASRLISLVKNSNVSNSDEMNIFENGMRQIMGHMLTPKLRADDVTLCAARTAYLSALMMKGVQSGETINNYNPEMNEQLKKVNSEVRFSGLNYIKGRSPEAFYYWWQTSILLES
jgi:hypothetical protein